MTDRGGMRQTRNLVVLAALLAVAAMLGLPWAAVGQTPGRYGYKQPLASAQLNTDLGGKADAVGGLLTKPQVRVSTGLTAFQLAEGLAGPSYPSPASADPLGVVHYGPVTINRATNGEEHRAGGLEVALNTQGDVGCSNGGFYEIPIGRAIYGGRDIVGACIDVVQAAPVALYAAASFSNDPATTVGQATAPAPQSTPVALTGRTVQGTKVTLATPLTPAQTARLTLGMVVETDNAFTGALTGWDAGGAWITVDAFVVIGSNPALMGYNPGSYGATNVTINANSQVYAINANVTLPAGGYRQQGTRPANGLVFEGAVRNDGATVARAEFNEFNDTPRVWGINMGAGGRVAVPGAGAFVSLGSWDKGFEVLSNTGYAGFLYGYGAGVPGEAAFLTQQNTGVAFAAKPQVRGGVRTFAVDSSSGAITSGLINTRQSVQITLSGPTSLDATSDYPVTNTGNPADPTQAMGNPNAVYSFDGIVSCSDGANGLVADFQGMWTTGASPAAAQNRAFASSAKASFGSIGAWRIAPATDTLTPSPILYFQGAPGVSCTAHATLMQVH